MGVIRTPETAGLEEATIEALQDLVQINIDSAEGFRHAADAVEDGALAADFRVWAADRTRQADELAGYLQLNDSEPPEERSWGAALHQTWLDLRAAVASGDAHAVLSEVERGEDRIKERYEEVLKETAGSGVNDVLQRQYVSVKGVHDRVRDLRNARRPK